MSNRSRREAASRAEARRRARAAAQAGPGTDVDAGERQPAVNGRARPQGGFLERIFPPAPPLPGKADPLAGFSYDGPMRGVVSTIYLLRRNPLAWLSAGILFGVCYLVMFRPGSQLVYTIASILSFVVLIAAGWLGWQRPWAFGLASAIVGYLLFLVIGLPTGWIEAPPSASEGAIATSIALSGLVQAAIGVLAGFYGGYLRRRMAAPSTGSNQRRRR